MKLSLNLLKPQQQPHKSPLQRTANFSLLSVRRAQKYWIPRQHSLDSLKIKSLSENQANKRDWYVTSDSTLDFDADINVSWQFVKSLEHKAHKLRIMENRVLTCYYALAEQSKIIQIIEQQQRKALDRLRKVYKTVK